MIIRAVPIALTLVLLALAACGGDSDDTPPASPTFVATPTIVNTVETTCGSEPAVARGLVETELLTEISGLVASRSQPGVLWAHNDSGDSARVFAMTDEGRHLGAYTLAGVEAIDWEDMALGPGPVEGTDYLYLGDIGDNAAERSQITVYRVPEPEAESGGELTDIEAFVFQYPDRPHDAEVLLVDPRDGTIYIITKELTGDPSTVFRAPNATSEPGVAALDAVLEEVATVDFQALNVAVAPPEDASVLVLGVGWLPTGGDVAPNRSAVVIRTYGGVWLWQIDSGDELWQAFAGEPCEALAAIEPQGEALAFDAESVGFYTASEGVNVPIYRTGLEWTISFE